jgi:hypothetical protein
VSYPRGVPSVAITYECLVCHASCPATVTSFDDPVASIAPRTQETLRKTRAILVRAGREVEGDPVDEIAAEILQQGARSALLYATCPRCGAKNPEGVTERARDERRWKWITFAILFVLAASAWFVRWIALVLPGLDLFFLRPMAHLPGRVLDDHSWGATGVLVDQDPHRARDAGSRLVGALPGAPRVMARPPPPDGSGQGGAGAGRQPTGPRRGRALVASGTVWHPLGGEEQLAEGGGGSTLGQHPGCITRRVIDRLIVRPARALDGLHRHAQELAHPGHF